MADTIDLDPGAFAEQAQRLTEAIGAFESWVTTFSQESRDALNGFNSDFIECFCIMLRHINDAAGPELLALICEYRDKVDTLATVFETTDDDLATGFEGGTN
jgi:hypothetical protein